MSKLKSIIVDDSPLAIESIKNMVDSFFSDEIEILQTFNQGTEALKVIHQLQPDIVFLDVEMPGMNGFEIKNLIPPSLNTKIVIISGEDSYALKAIKNTVFDFLVKPIVLSDFRECLNKLKTTIEKEQFVKNQIDNNVLIINRQDKTIFITIQSITHIEASGPYSIIHYDGKKISSSKNFKHYETLLDESIFYKVHRSCLINLNKIKEIQKFEGDGAVVLTDGSKIELSKPKKDELLKTILKNHKN